ncbi:dihydrolipoyl dehydrogenase family protein [Caldisalinibacter kiritimatiensis]|uniref:Dihydrolipoamide dehydrogenase n=1 Tax=Caldisalinibacter kiritimatiensis TaxID=1304284 RepID=R1CFN2_9FIRM|nr:NAD(P)/FAD-dependent oxidoreductase [Caldisalinibacter kiritimatiensis]EOD01115.1 Dihydrolipoamide dehydrogenase [Caldisalinibacter kiritimatiensis]
MQQYDIIVIGLGPAGMAVAGMASSMNLKVLAVERHKIGGECLNYGCIPSKALLKAAEANIIANTLEKFGLELSGKTVVNNPLQIVQDKINKINSPKTMKMFDKVDLVIGEGDAQFVDSHTIQVGDKKYTGKTIFIATGTEPFIPPIPGLKDVPILTNQNVFEPKDVPETLTVIGGGAIGTEMAQAFSRLGSKVTLVQMDPHLIPIGDEEAGRLLEEVFTEEGIEVYNSTKIEKVEKVGDKIITYTDKGVFESDEILVATGRAPAVDSLGLDNAGIEYTKKGIAVDEYFRTNHKHIYAVGDCNGKALLSHAAMHQGMLALFNSQSPQTVERLKWSNYVVPWSVFTKPEIAQVGLTEKEAKEQGIDYIVIKEEYENYGRTLADGQPIGFVKVITDNQGKIYGATIAGDGASELIHEWALAIQYGLTMFNIAMMQHSFPTLSLMNKRAAEQWMMKAMQSGSMEQMMAALMK